jgi:hypothetical protein
MKIFHSIKERKQKQTLSQNLQKDSVELHGFYLVFSSVHGKSHLAFILKHLKTVRGWVTLSIHHLSDYMLLKLEPTKPSEFLSAWDGLGITDRNMSSRTREKLNSKDLGL